MDRTKSLIYLQHREWTAACFVPVIQPRRPFLVTSRIRSHKYHDKECRFHITGSPEKSSIWQKRGSCIIHFSKENSSFQSFFAFAWSEVDLIVLLRRVSSATMIKTLVRLYEPMPDSKRDGRAQYRFLASCAGKTGELVHIAVHLPGCPLVKHVGFRQTDCGKAPRDRHPLSRIMLGAI